jgi:hypothetical protein
LQRDAGVVRPHVNLARGQARVGVLHPLFQAALGWLPRGIQDPLIAARHAAA